MKHTRYVVEDRTYCLDWYCVIDKCADIGEKVVRSGISTRKDAQRIADSFNLVDQEERPA